MAKITQPKAAPKKVAPSKTAASKVSPAKVAAAKATPAKAKTTTATKSKTTASKVIAPKVASEKSPTIKIAKKIASKPTKVILTDDDIDIELFDQENNVKALKANVKSALAERSATAFALCPQGKQPKVIRDNPSLTPPLDTNNYIQSLHVKLSAQLLTITWTDGSVEQILCSPNPKLTPQITDVVGFKCGPKHTNFKRDGMAWFTALKSKGMAYGFHNSQPVGKGIVSHGCIRVPCEYAKKINNNSWSGKTVIKIIK